MAIPYNVPGVKNPIQYSPAIIRANAFRKLTADVAKLTATVEGMREDVAFLRKKWKAERAAR